MQKPKQTPWIHLRMTYEKFDFSAAGVIKHAQMTSVLVMLLLSCYFSSSTCGLVKVKDSVQEVQSEH